MAKANYTSNGNRPMTKEEMRARQQRRQMAERKKMLAERHDVAVSNSKERQARTYAGLGRGTNYIDAPFYQQDYAPAGYAEPSVDNRFIQDVQKMKFCRKPIGFIMSIIFLVCIALVALSFVNLGVAEIDTYTALFTESEVQAPASSENDQTPDEGEQTPADDEQSAANAAFSGVVMADDADADADATDTNSEDAGDTEEGATTETAAATNYKFSDPVYGWISYIARLVNFDLELGDSPWYDAQISKVETGMSDTVAALLIQAFPAAIILYVIFALTLFIKTFICWASGDRRIYRHTGIECFIMIILALIVAMGGLASTVEVDGKLAFDGIVNYLIGAITKTGGFTAGFGLLIMVALPLVGMILSWFLLEKKLRNRDVTQPIIVYEYKKRQGN